MLEPAGIRIKSLDLELKSLRADLSRTMTRRDAAAVEKLEANKELQIARAQLGTLERMNMIMFRGKHESRLKEAREREEHASRACHVNQLKEALEQEKLNEIQSKIEDIERRKKNLKLHMLDYESGYHFLPESMIGMSRLWECIRRRIRLFEAEGAISAVYRPLALIGSPGVGKTRALQPIRGMLYSAGVLPSERIYSVCIDVYVDADIEHAIDRIDRESHGILHVDASDYQYTHDPESKQHRRNMEALASTEHVVRRLLEAYPRLLVVIECRSAAAEEVLAAFDDISGAFVRPSDQIICDDLGSEDLISLLLEHAVSLGPDRNVCLDMADDAAKVELARGLDLAKSIQGDRFAYGKILDQLGNDLVTSAIELGGSKTPQGKFIITSEVARSALEGGGWIPSMEGESDRERVRTAVMAELDSLIGLGSVKETFATIERTLEFKKRVAGREGSGYLGLRGRKPSFAFLGPAGTGKTTVARLMARLLYGIGVCDTDKLVAVNSSDLIAGYIGQSGSKTKSVIESARGGVLFIDEAYNLRVSEDSNGRGDFVDAVIQELLVAMTSEDCNVVFVFAGYKDSMESFFSANEGIKSRITNYVYFDAYGSDELVQMVVSKLEIEGFYLTTRALAPLERLMVHISTLGEEYANARGAEKIVSEIVDAKALLWGRDPERADVHEMDSEVVYEVMRKHGVVALDIREAAIDPARAVMRDHGCDRADVCEPCHNNVRNPMPAQEVEAPAVCARPLRDGDYKTLRGWLKFFKEAGLLQEGIDASKGPMAINDVLEAGGYITPKPYRRFKKKALTELDVREERRSGKTGSYVALLYSREAFGTALRMWRELEEGGCD